MRQLATATPGTSLSTYTNCIFEDNVAESESTLTTSGGAIAYTGAVSSTITDSSFVNNVADCR